jgi:hypothetical protein
MACGGYGDGVQAMDAIQQFAGCNYCDSYASWQVDHPGSGKTWGPVTRFVVGGASKRGWTTWTTGIADHRVAAIVPVRKIAVCSWFVRHVRVNHLIICRDRPGTNIQRNDGARVCVFSRW